MNFAKFNPLVIGSDLLRRTILFNASFSEIWGGLLVLFLFTLAAVLLVPAVYYGVKKNKFSKYLAKFAPKKEPLQ